MSAEGEGDRSSSSSSANHNFVMQPSGTLYSVLGHYVGLVKIYLDTSVLLAAEMWIRKLCIECKWQNARKIYKRIYQRKVLSRSVVAISSLQQPAAAASAPDNAHLNLRVLMLDARPPLCCRSSQTNWKLFAVFSYFYYISAAAESWYCVWNLKLIVRGAEWSGLFWKR